MLLKFMDNFAAWLIPLTEEVVLREREQGVYHSLGTYMEPFSANDSRDS